MSEMTPKRLAEIREIRNGLAGSVGGRHRDEQVGARDAIDDLLALLDEAVGLLAERCDCAATNWDGETCSVWSKWETFLAKVKEADDEG